MATHRAVESGEVAPKESMAFIYIKRCTCGTRTFPSTLEWSGEHKVGFTKDQPNARNVQGQLSTEAVDIVHWELPTQRAQEIELKLHSAKSPLSQYNPRHNRKLTEWQVKAKEIYRVPLQQAEDADKFLMLLVQSCITQAMGLWWKPNITHNSLEAFAGFTCGMDIGDNPPPKSDGHCKKRQRIEKPSEMPEVLNSWYTPANDEDFCRMAKFLADAIVQCPQRPPRCRAFPPSKETARKVGMVGIALMASFVKNTSWNGENISEIKSSIELKEILNQTKHFETKFFGQSGCGPQSGSQCITWIEQLQKHGMMVKLKETGDNIRLSMNFGSMESAGLCKFL